MQSRTIFALDIGTRKVMGVVAERRGDMLEILESETQEHPTRAMSAGQIQDVPKVTQVVRQVVRALSEAQRPGTAGCGGRRGGKKSEDGREMRP